MNLFNMLLACSGIFALLHWYIVPIAEKRWKSSSAARIVAKSAGLGLLGFAKALCAIGAVTYALFVIGFWIIDSGGGASSSELSGAIESVASLRTTVSDWKSTWAVIFFLALILLLGTIAYLSGAKYGQKRLLAAFEKESDAYHDQQADGSLIFLPPTPRMAEVEREISRLSSLIRNSNSRNERHSAEIVFDKLQQLRTDLDIERRVELSWDPNENVHEESSTGSSLLKALTSEGIVRSLKGVSKGFFVVGLSLMFLSLIALHGPVVGSKLEERAINLEELHVTALQDETIREWAQVAETAVEQSVEEEESNEELYEEQLAELGRLFEEEFLWADYLPVVPQVSSSSRALQQLAVREALLKRSVEHAPSKRHLFTHESLSQASKLSGLQREGVALVEQSVRVSGPRTSLGKRFVKQVRDSIPSASDTWKRISSNLDDYQNSFRRPAKMHDVSRLIAGEAFGLAVDGLAPVADSEIGKLARSLLTKGGTPAVERLFDAKLSEFMLDAVQDGGFEQLRTSTKVLEARPPLPITRSLSESVRQSFAPLHKLGGEAAQLLETRPPGIGYAQALEVDAAKIQSEVRSLRSLASNTGRSIRPDFMTEALLRYPDIAPAQLGLERVTLLGSTVQSIDPKWFDQPSAARATGMGVSQMGKAAIRAPKPARVLARGRSFLRMRGFARVGGVLIGREPDNASTANLDFVDISWELTDSGYTIELTRNDGRVFSFGPFSAELTHQALTYAADGRPLAVTMTTAEPLLDLKIHLHPALLDTALGCRTIELDRFVDSYTTEGSGSRRAAVTERIQMQTELYSLAWTLRLAALESILGDEAAAEAVLEGVVEQVRLMDSEAMLSSIKGDLTEHNSPLIAMNEYFDPQLVLSLVQIPADASSLEAQSRRLYGQFRNELEGLAKAITLMQDYSQAEALLGRYYRPPPEYQVWSGVRETAFDLDVELEFLRPNGQDLWPFRFLVQTAFTSEPGFLDVNEDPSQYDVTDPWEFPELASEIEKLVMSGVRGDPGRASVLRDLAEFTLLQRLFRVILDGHFGGRFPVEKLVQLCDASADASPAYVHTARWNYRSGLLEIAYLGSFEELARASLEMNEWQLKGIGELRARIQEAEELHARLSGQTIHALSASLSGNDPAFLASLRSLVKDVRNKLGLDTLLSELNQRASDRDLAGLLDAASTLAMLESAMDLRRELLVDGEWEFHTQQGCPPLR